MFGLWICILVITNAPNSLSDTPMVVGGAKANITQYPFAAWLRYRGKYRCGAVILNDRMVLTSAHCKRPGESQGFLVYTGSHFVEKGKPHQVCNFVTYKNNAGQSMIDIAIVLLKSNIAFNQYTQPARLPIYNKWRNEKSKFEVIGFGRNATNNLSRHLLMTKMRFLNSEDCETYPKTNNYLPVTEYRFCMIGKKNNGPCHGDSGSAVVWKRLVVGLVTGSRNGTCGSQSVPSINEDLFFCSKWIKATVKVLKSKKC